MTRHAGDPLTEVRCPHCHRRVADAEPPTVIRLRCPKCKELIEVMVLPPGSRAGI